MLSRVADSLYWMSRYLERAEHTARLLDVNLHQMLDQTPQSAGRRWHRVVAALRSPHPGDAPYDPYRITHTLTVDTANPTSIASCIATARDNARQAWEQISTEMWEQINTLYLGVKDTDMDQIWLEEPHAFFSAIKEGIHLFQGITDATMSHGEGWQFIQAGRYIERARSTAALLDVHFTPSSDEDRDPDGYLEWVGLLKSCSAFEAYVKVFTASIERENIAAFLLLDAEFPRSVRFAATCIQDSLHAMGGRGATRPNRLAGRLRAALDYSQIDEVLSDDTHEYLAFIEQQCDQIHAAVYGTYIGYPVAAALTSGRTVR
ncbi:MAG: alpha-E domain-containing protein [Chloroflexota bacterium]